jgi:hypothetical protein
LHPFTSDIEISILQANHFINIVCTGVNGKRWWLGRVQNLDDAVTYLHHAGSERRIHGSLGTSTHDSGDPDDIFATNIYIIVDNALHDSGMIAYVEKREVFSVFATTSHPTAQRDSLANACYI